MVGKGGRLQLATEYPPRKQALLILQVRGMPFSRHVVVELGDQLVGVDSWWAAITQAGGPSRSNKMHMYSGPTARVDPPPLTRHNAARSGMPLARIAEPFKQRAAFVGGLMPGVCFGDPADPRYMQYVLRRMDQACEHCRGAPLGGGAATRLEPHTPQVWQLLQGRHGGLPCESRTRA
jgi:hypothetical protein